MGEGYDTIPSGARDVFALGLVMWALAEEVAVFKRQERFVRPFLAWNEGTPRELRELAMSCLDDNPDLRPSAQGIYEVVGFAHEHQAR